MRPILKRLLVIHPFLFAVFPVLFLFARNFDEVPAGDLFLPLLGALALTAILFFASRLITKNDIKSGLVTSAFLALFFSYGRVLALILPLTGWVKGTLMLASFWVVLFATSVILILRSRRDFVRLTRVLMVIAVVLVLIPVTNIVGYEVRTSGRIQNTASQMTVASNQNPTANLPDIYYLIVDSYARASSLEEIYHYDNSDFVSYLTQKGFYVASRSRSNYAQSTLSLAASLNMEYLEAKEVGALRDILRTNEVSRLMRDKGYKTIYISSGFFSKGFTDYAEVHLPEKSAFGINMPDFAVGLIDTTALQPFRSLIGADARKDILYVFNEIASIPDLKQPTFVIAHLLGVHTPFVFDSEGKSPLRTALKATNVPEYYKEGYINQLVFVNKKLKELIDQIVSKSETEPIIILQADHGPGSTLQQEVALGELSERQLNERMNILNAYLLPGNGDQLYETVTPVNTFRIVFDSYFGANYELLEDKSYFSNYEAPFDFIVVPPED